MRSVAAVIFTIGWSAAAGAQQAPETIFACEIGEKRLELRLDVRAAHYRFGPPGAPELELLRDASEIDYTPWPGIGRHLFESARLANGTHSYEVWHSIDRLDPEAAMEGGVRVWQAETELADLLCDPGSVSADLYALYGALEAAGYCFSLDTRLWSPCNE